MGRVQVVIDDNIETEFREKLGREGKTRKGDISAEVQDLMARSIGEEGNFIKEEPGIKLPEETFAQANEFYQNVDTLEKSLKQPLILHHDLRSDSFYTTCHVSAKTLKSLANLDMAVDPEFQPDFRANRLLQKKNPTFLKMLEDAKAGREFADIIVEYPTAPTTKFPNKSLDVIGGQHRTDAIEEGLPTNRYHGLRVYFNLNTKQRIDLYKISNTNIDVPIDLLDRLDEQGMTPPNLLRQFCWETGLLEKNKDFGERRSTEEEAGVTVRTVRMFIVNFYDGENFKGDIDSTPIIPENSNTKIDKKYKELYEKASKYASGFLNDHALSDAGKAFVALNKKQFETVSKSDLVSKKEFRAKALSTAVVSSWSFAAGVLQTKSERLERLYALPSVSGTSDPLNAKAMSAAKIEDDPATYRGLGARYGSEDRGRMLKLFVMYSQPRKLVKITKELCEAAMQKFESERSSLKAKNLLEKIS